jgi:hypothetical protein
MANEREVFKKNFPDASIERMFFGGWRINTRTGFVEYKKKHFTKLVGGPAEYRGVLLSLKDFGSSHVTVSGGEKHILSATAHGLDLGIPVVPEIKAPGAGCLRGCLILFCLPIAFCVCVSITEPFIEDDEIRSVVGIVLTIVVMQWFTEKLKKSAKRAAQERGQIYRNTMPDVHGDVQHPVRPDEVAEEFFRRD